MTNHICKSKTAKPFLTTLLLVGLCLILSAGLCSALVETLGTFKQNTCVNLVQTCSNCTYNNVTTVNYPDGSTLTLNKLMTKSGTNYNYTFCSTSQLGDYIVNGVSDVLGTGTTSVWAYDFVITTTGSDKTLYIPLFLLLGAFIIFGFASYLKNEYIGLFSGFLFIVAGIYMMIYGLGNFADTYTRAIAFITLGIGLSVSFIAVIEMFYTPLGVTRGEDD